MATRTVETKFWEFSQNNSGGGFLTDHDRGISHFVIIEAQNADEANLRAKGVGIYFDGCETNQDCSCCGDRWYEASGSGDDLPTLYGVRPWMHEDLWMTDDVNHTYIHYYDGSVVGYSNNSKGEALRAAKRE